MGFHDHALDMIDERRFTKSEIRDFCLLLFGECDGMPGPDTDWDGFSMYVKELLDKEDLQWNPVTKTMGPWIDMKKLNRMYGDRNILMMMNDITVYSSIVAIIAVAILLLFQASIWIDNV